MLDQENIFKEVIVKIQGNGEFEILKAATLTIFESIFAEKSQKNKKR